MDNHEYMGRLASRLFPRSIPVSISVKEHNDIVEFATALHTNHKTNVSDKPASISFETARNGAIVEMGIKTALGINRRVTSSIDLKDETTYARDFVWEGGRGEVKSITPGFEGRGMISYNARAAQTMLKHKDSLNAIVFANIKMVDDLNWFVDVAWVINPEYFCAPYLTSNHDGSYLKFEPIRHERLRKPEVCLWNPRVVTAMNED